MIRLSFTISLLISIVACVPVQPQAQQQTAGAPAGEPGASSAPSGGPEHDEACRGACTVFDQCGKQPFDRCTRECEGAETERLQRFASFSCEELTAVLSGTVGSQCMSYGKNDCAPLGPQYGCCGGNEATRTPGQCLDMAVCGMPRY